MKPTITLRFSSRDRYRKAITHLWNHPDRYALICRGKDYGAMLKDRITGCGWYIEYRKI